MQMVAAAKMRKAQQAALAGRPYASLMNEVLAEVAANAGDFTHPLMEVREIRKRAVIVVSTDKGLCGALNSNLLREAVKFHKDTTVYLTAGRKASQFVARTKRQLAAEFTYKDTPLFSEARAMPRFTLSPSIQGAVAAKDILFGNFIRTAKQRREARSLMTGGEIKAMHAEVEESSGDSAELIKGATEFLFEPGADQVLGG